MTAGLSDRRVAGLSSVQRVPGDGMDDWQTERTTTRVWRASNHFNSARNAETALHPADVRPFGAWFVHHGLSVHGVAVVVYGGVFAVARSDIRRHPRSWLFV